MEQKKTKTYTIREFADLTGVTLRTLHHYDEIGLLKPSGYNQQGHRQYTSTDLISLQKIVTLKFLGFPLSQIKTMIQEDQSDMRASLQFQQQMIKEKREHLDRVYRGLAYALHAFEEEEQIDWGVFVTLILSIQKEKEHKEWFKRYVDQELVEKLYDMSDEEQKEINKQFANLIKQFKQLLGTDPSSGPVQELVQQYLQLADQMVKGDERFYQQLTQQIEKIEAEDLDQNLFPSPFSPELEQFMEEAFVHYIQNEEQQSKSGFGAKAAEGEKQ
jgi:DNA-binding transcriptional MerR regulator